MGTHESHGMPVFIGGGGEDRTPDIGVMNPETMHFRTVDTVRVFQLHQ